MRRKDREVTDPKSIQAIVDSCKVFRVAMSAQGMPYIVPLNFGYSCLDGRYEFYFHCAHQGKKLDILKQNSAVCFEMDTAHQLVEGDSACSYSFKSVVGTGNAAIITGSKEKTSALQRIMKHQTGKDFSFSKQQLESVTVCKITATEICAKQH